MSEWVERLFAEVADYGVGRTPSRSNPAFWEREADSTAWVAISDMAPFGSVKSTRETVTAFAIAKVFGGRVIPAGTLLMSFKLTIGRVATLETPAVHNEAIISIYPKPGMDQRFLAYYLSQVDYTLSQDRQIKGNTLNKAKIDQIPVRVPPEEEQVQIADLLDLVRGAVQSETSALAQAEVLKRSVMQELFTRGLRGEEPQDSVIGPIPAGWEVRAVAELCDIWSGGTPRKGIEQYWSGDIPWVSGKDLKRPVIDDAIDHLSPEGVMAGSRLAPENAVLLLVRGMGLAKDLPVATIARPMAFNQDVKALITKDENLAYRGNFLRSAIYAGKERLLSQIVPSAHGTMTLNLNDVESMLLPWPTGPDEALQVGAVIQALDAKIDLHRRKRALYEELFQTLLQGLMTRAIDIDDLDLSGAPSFEVVPG